MESSQNLPQEVILKDYVEIIRRRKWAVLETFGLVVAVGVLATAVTTPIFRTEGKLVVQEASSNVSTVDTQNPLADLVALAQPENVDTQIAVLQSDTFVERVLQKSEASPRSTPQINVTRVAGTNIVDVAVEGPDAKLAARIANTLLDEYLEYTRENSLKEIRAAKRFVERERFRAQQALEKAERNLLAFRGLHRVTQLTAEQESRTKELADLETRQRENENAIARANAQLHEVEAQFGREPEAKRAPVGRPNPRREALEGKLAELEMQQAALREEYREHTPMVASINAQIGRVKERLRAEPTELAVMTANPARDELRARRRELDRELRSLQAEHDHLSAQLAGEQTRVNQLGPWEVQLAQLNRVRNTAEKSFLMLDGKLQDLAIRENSRRSTTRILDHAPTPTVPVRPRKAANAMVAAIMGLVLGLSVAFLQEYLDDRVTTSAEAERALDLPTLAYVPLIPAHQSVLLTELPSRSRVAESYRTLRSAISFEAGDQPLRTIVVSSPEVNDGKSVTALNLAIAMAMEGRRVILVDADLRRPTLHGMLEWETSPGLTEVLEGTRELSETLREFPAAPGLRIMTSGRLPQNPAELLNSAPMEALIGRLTEEADVVLFDSPPCLPVTDALLLAAKVDGVVLVAAIGEVRRAALKQTKEQFERARARLVGLVFNKVSGNEGSTYGYYQRGYYDEGSRAIGSGNLNGREERRQHGDKRRALTGQSAQGEEPENG